MTVSQKSLLRARAVVEGFASLFQGLREAEEENYDDVDYEDVAPEGMADYGLEMPGSDWLSDGQLSSYEVARANALPNARWARETGLPVIAWAMALKSPSGNARADKASRQFSERVLLLFSQWQSGAISTPQLFAAIKAEMHKQGKNAYTAGKVAMGDVSSFTVRNEADLRDLFADEDDALDGFEEDFSDSDMSDLLKEAKNLGLWDKMGLVAGGLTTGMATDPTNYAQAAWSFMNRLSMYASSLASYQSLGEMSAFDGVDGQTLVWWELGASNHCADCLAMSDHSPFWLSVLEEKRVFPGSGHTRCGGRCNCGLNYDTPTMYCGDSINPDDESVGELDIIGESAAPLNSIWVQEAASCKLPVSAHDLPTSNRTPTTDANLFDWNDELMNQMEGGLSDSVAWDSAMKNSSFKDLFGWLTDTKVKDRPLGPRQFPDVSRRRIDLPIVPDVQGLGAIGLDTFVPATDEAEFTARMHVFAPQLDWGVFAKRVSEERGAAYGFEKEYLNSVLSRTELLDEIGLPFKQIDSVYVGTTKEVSSGNWNGIWAGFEKKLGLAPEPGYVTWSGQLSRSTSRSIGDTWAHEVGHSVHSAILSGPDRGAFDDRLEALRNGLSRSQMAKKVSPYSTDNAHEWFAEVFQTTTRPGYVKGTIPFDEAFWKILVDAGQVREAPFGPEIGKLQYVDTNGAKKLRVGTLTAPSHEYRFAYHQSSSGVWFDFGATIKGDQLIDPEFTMKALTQVGEVATASKKSLYVNAQTVNVGMENWLLRLGARKVVRSDREWWQIENPNYFVAKIQVPALPRTRLAPSSPSALGQFSLIPLPTKASSLADQWTYDRLALDRTLSAHLPAKFTTLSDRIIETEYNVGSVSGRFAISHPQSAPFEASYGVLLSTTWPTDAVSDLRTADDIFRANLLQVVMTHDEILRNRAFQAYVDATDSVLFSSRSFLGFGGDKFRDLLYQVGGRAVPKGTLSDLGQEAISLSRVQFDDLARRISKDLALEPPSSALLPKFSRGSIGAENPYMRSRLSFKLGAGIEDRALVGTTDWRWKWSPYEPGRPRDFSADLYRDRNQLHLRSANLGLSVGRDAPGEEFEYVLATLDQIAYRLGKLVPGAEDLTKINSLVFDAGWNTSLRGTPAGDLLTALKAVPAGPSGQIRWTVTRENLIEFRARLLAEMGPQDLYKVLPDEAVRVKAFNPDLVAEAARVTTVKTVLRADGGLPTLRWQQYRGTTGLGTGEARYAGAVGHLQGMLKANPGVGQVIIDQEILVKSPEMRNFLVSFGARPRSSGGLTLDRGVLDRLMGVFDPTATKLDITDVGGLRFRYEYKGALKADIVDGRETVTLSVVTSGERDQAAVTRLFKDVLSRAEQRNVRLAVDDAALLRVPGLRETLVKYGGQEGRHGTKTWIDLSIEDTRRLQRDLDSQPGLLFRPNQLTAIQAPSDTARLAAVTGPEAGLVRASRAAPGQDAQMWPGFAWPDPTKLEIVPIDLSKKAQWGFTPKAFFTDPDGHRWIFKMSKTGTDYRFAVSEDATDLAKALGLQTPDVKTYKAVMPTSVVRSMGVKAGVRDLGNGMSEVEGILSPILPGKIRTVGAPAMNANARMKAVSALEPEHVQDLLNQQVLDRLLANDDAHMGQWIVDAQGKLWAIDKDRAFERLMKDGDSLDPWLNGNGRGNAAFAPLANLFWRDVEAKPALLSLIHPGTIVETLRRAEAISDQEYLHLFDQILGMKRANPEGVYSQFKTVKEMEDALLARKHGVTNDFEQLWAGQIKKALANDADQVPEEWKAWMTSGGRFDLAKPAEIPLAAPLPAPAIPVAPAVVQVAPSTNVGFVYGKNLVSEVPSRISAPEGSPAVLETRVAELYSFNKFGALARADDKVMSSVEKQYADATDHLSWGEKTPTKFGEVAQDVWRALSPADQRHMLDLEAWDLISGRILPSANAFGDDARKVYDASRGTVRMQVTLERNGRTLEEVLADVQANGLSRPPVLATTSTRDFGLKTTANQAVVYFDVPAGRYASFKGQVILADAFDPASIVHVAAGSGLFGSRAIREYAGPVIEVDSTAGGSLIGEAYVRRMAPHKLREVEAWASARGIPVDQYIDELQGAVREVMSTALVVSRVKPKTLDKILSSGRFKTQFETGKSEGLLSPQSRGALEKLAMNVPEHGDAHPVYGFLMTEGQPIGKAESEALEQYGRIAVVFKPEIKDRTTWTASDSLRTIDFRGVQSPILGATPSVVNDPSWMTVSVPFSPSTVDPLDALRGKNLGATSEFVEAQIHGQARVEDIAEVIFAARPESALRSHLESLGIPWRVDKKVIDGVDDSPVVPREAFPSKHPGGVRLGNVYDQNQTWGLAWWYYEMQPFTGLHIDMDQVLTAVVDPSSSVGARIITVTKLTDEQARQMKRLGINWSTEADDIAKHGSPIMPARLPFELTKAPSSYPSKLPQGLDFGYDKTKQIDAQIIGYERVYSDRYGGFVDGLVWGTNPPAEVAAWLDEAGVPYRVDPRARAVSSSGLTPRSVRDQTERWSRSPIDLSSSLRRSTP